VRIRIFPFLEVVVAATALKVQGRSDRLDVVAFDPGFDLRKAALARARQQDTEPASPPYQLSNMQAKPLPLAWRSSVMRWS